MVVAAAVETQLVIRDGLFRTADSPMDSRLDGHPYQVVVVSYHGAPIILQKEVWGTMCHFDLSDLPMPDDEFELLNAAAAAWPTATPAERTASKPLGDF